MKARTVRLWIAATLWMLAIAGNAGALFHLKWWVVLTPLWVSLAVLVGYFVTYFLLTASAALEVLSWIVVRRANISRLYRLSTRRQERERRLILRGMQAGFLMGDDWSRARGNHVEPDPRQQAERSMPARREQKPEPSPQPDRTHGN